MIGRTSVDPDLDLEVGIDESVEIDERLLTARLVIVDDEPTNVLVLEHLLSRMGYQDVVGLTDPREAIALLDAGEVDLLLLDLHMPDIDGFEVLEHRATAVDVPELVPVLVLTADAQSETRDRALRLGATDFLTKPFDHAEVLLRIRNVLHLRQLHADALLENHELTRTVTRRTQDLQRIGEWLDAVDDAVVIHDIPDGRVLYANDRARTLIEAGRDWRDGGIAMDAVVTAGGAFPVLAGQAEQVRFQVGIASPGDAPVAHDVSVQRVLRGQPGEAVVVVARDATERVRTEQRLRRLAALEHAAAEEAHAMHEAKQRFLTSLSHEVRTPLAVVGGLAELVGRKELEPPQRDQLVGTLCDRVEGLSRLMLDLLSIATEAVDAGGRELRRTPLHDVVQCVADEVAGRAVEVTATPAEALVDPCMFRRAVVHLIDNAVRFSEEGETIRVDLSRSGADIVLTVEDGGGGIPETVRDRAFEPFAQGCNVPTDNPGPGIGLTLVQRFARLHGGHAWVDSTGPDGTRVALRLPADELGADSVPAAGGDG